MPRLGAVVKNTSTKKQNWAFNSNFDIYQRGPAIGPFVALDAFNYGPDRWGHRFEAGGGSTANGMSIQADTPNEAIGRQCVRVDSSAGTATGVLQNAMRQIWEVTDARRFLFPEGSFSIGFWYRSNVTGTHAISYDATFAFTGTGLNGSASFEVDVANTWKFYQFTFTGLSVATTLANDNAAGVLIDIGPRTAGLGQSTWNNGNEFRLFGVMVNSGPALSEWSLRGGGFDGELSLCQRYYEKSFDLYTAPANGPNSTAFISTKGMFVGYGLAESILGNTRATQTTYKVPKRISDPIIVRYGNNLGEWLHYGDDNVLRFFDYSDAGRGENSFYSSVAAGSHQGGMVFGHWTANAEL